MSSDHLNIIIPYRQAPADGIELRYALRSIDKYLKGYSDVIIVGHKFPSWLTGITKVMKSEETTKSERNIYEKILEGFKNDTRLLQWQDDIYLTRPLHVTEIKYWFDGTFDEQLANHHGRYKQMMMDTAMKITDSALFYDIHTPIIYERGNFSKLKRYSWDKKNFCLKSLYCYEAGVIGDHMADCKNVANINGHLFFSSSPYTLNEKMVDMLEQMFPEKSRYEK